MLPLLFGWADRGEGVFLVVLYLHVLIDSLLIYFLCWLSPRTEEWIYHSFGRKLVTILCGNQPMHHSMRVAATVMLYGLGRHVDGVIADSRMHTNRELLLQSRKEQGVTKERMKRPGTPRKNVPKNGPERVLYEIWRVQLRRVLALFFTAGLKRTKHLSFAPIVA